MVLNETVPFCIIEECAGDVKVDDMWTCACGAVNQPNRKRCSPPCSRWKMGCKRAQKTALKRRSRAGAARKLTDQMIKRKTTSPIQQWTLAALPVIDRQEVPRSRSCYQRLALDPE